MHGQQDMQFDCVKGQNREVHCRQSFQLRSLFMIGYKHLYARPLWGVSGFD